MTARQQWATVLAVVAVLALALGAAMYFLGDEMFPVTVGSAAARGGAAAAPALIEISGITKHYVTPGGVELDLTRDQFTPAESLIHHRRVTTGRSSSTAGEQPFQLLQKRVTAALGS